jgi:hypothetical protein
MRVVRLLPIASLLRLLKFVPKVTICSTRTDFSVLAGAVVDDLDATIKQAEAALPVTAQAGVMRWGRALGMV